MELLTERLGKYEQEMRELAISIRKRYIDVCDIADPKVAGRMVAGVIQYLQEPLDNQHKLDDLEQNWNLGYVDKADYLKQKAALLA